MKVLRINRNYTTNTYSVSLSLDIQGLSPEFVERIDEILTEIGINTSALLRDDDGTIAASVEDVYPPDCQ